MKKIFFVILVLWSAVSYSQAPNYNNYNARNHWWMISTNGINIPAGATPAKQTGQYARSGALYYDTTGVDTGLYVSHGAYWVKLLALNDVSTFITTRDRFGFVAEDTRATAARYFSSANQVFTIDSLGNGSRFISHPTALVDRKISIVNTNGTDSSYVSINGQTGIRTAIMGVNNTVTGTASDLGAYMRFLSGASTTRALQGEIYVSTEPGTGRYIGHVYVDTFRTRIATYLGDFSKYSYINTYRDSISLWHESGGKFSGMQMGSGWADQWADDRLAWRTTDSTGKIVIEKNLVELYAGENAIELEDPTGITIEPYKNNLFIDSLDNTIDTTTNKPLGWSPSTGRVVRFNSWAQVAGAGGSTPTLQQVLTAGSTLTTSNTITIPNGEGLTINGNNSTSSFTVNVNAKERILATNALTTITGGTGSTSGNISAVIVGDSIHLWPYQGKLNIDSLRSGYIDTTNYKPLARKITDGGVGGDIVQMNSWAQVSGGGSSSLTVGTTPIVSGTAPRLFYQTAGNVLGQTNGAVWDVTNSAMAIGATASENAATLLQVGNGSAAARVTIRSSGGFNIGLGDASTMVWYGNSGGLHTWWNSSGTQGMTLDASTPKLVVGSGTATSTIHSSGSLATGYRAITALRTLDITDHTIEVTSGTFTVTLPVSTTCVGREYRITNSGSGVITVASQSSETFRNVTGVPTSLTLNQFNTVIISSANGAWLRVSSL